MNALNLYVTTCRMVLQSGADDSSAWADISRLFSCLRQSLACCVCEKILTIPTSSTESNCNHHVCKSCIGGKMRVKPTCIRCTDSSKFIENAQIRIVLQCYKKLCQYIASSSLHRKWANLNGGTTGNLGELVQEGADLPCDFRPPTSTVGSLTYRTYIPSSTAFPKLLEGIPTITSTVATSDGASNSVMNGNGSVYSVTVADTNSTKIMIKRTNAESSESEASNFDSIENPPNSISVKDIVTSAETSKTFKPRRKGCRCGWAARNPGQLTCCGQRCLCYVDKKACDMCRCRGCRNPNKFSKSGLVQVLQPMEQEKSEIELCIDNTIDTNT